MEEKDVFIPEYSNIMHWYPDEIFEVLSHYWAGVKKLEDDIYKWIIQATLVKMSKLFSLAEHRTPKLFRSKYKTHFITDILKTNYSSIRIKFSILF